MTTLERNEGGRLAGAIAVILVTLGATQAVAQPSPTDDAPSPVPLDDARQTAKLTKLRYDADRKAYVVQATIALAALSQPKAQRAKTALRAQLVVKRGGETKRLASTTNLSVIEVVQQNPRDGIATVQVTVAGPKADDMGAIRTDVDLVGANPTPHP